MANQPKPQPAGPKALSGSAEAKRKAAVILECLVGLRTTQSASDELGVALVRYYVLETRMLQAMIHALEPKARGRQRSLDAEIRQLREDNQKLQREAMRLQALYRVTQRAVGVKDDKKSGGNAKGAKAPKTRRTRRQSRGERVLAALRSGQQTGSSEEDATAAATIPPDAAQGGA